MKTYIVPVDFSSTSVHAAEYAALLSKQTDVNRIVLLHSYYVSVYQSVLPTPDMVMLSEESIEDETEAKLNQLQQIRQRIAQLGRHGLAFEVHISRETLTRSIIESIAFYGASLVILGSNGNNSGNDSHVGLNAINISRFSPVPVIVVPPACHYEPVTRVVMACDFKKIRESLPLEGLRTLLSKYRVPLLVVNIDKQASRRNADPKELAETSALAGQLREFEPQYFYNESDDVIGGILDFARKHRAQLVIALPDQYSFFQSLLRDSVCKQLTIHSSVPVLLLK